LSFEGNRICAFLGSGLNSSQSEMIEKKKRVQNGRGRRRKDRRRRLN
jgi:hypothetical protein